LVRRRDLPPFLVRGLDCDLWDATPAARSMRITGSTRIDAPSPPIAEGGTALAFSSGNLTNKPIEGLLGPPPECPDFPK
jgi:hypothetical protein